VVVVVELLLVFLVLVMMLMLVLVVVVVAGWKVDTFGLGEPVATLRLLIDLFDLARLEEVTDLQHYQLFDV
jgi:hypothetical protein